MLESHPNDVITRTHSKPDLPSRLRLGRGPQPVDGIGPPLAQPRPQEDLGRLRRTVMRAAAAKQIRLTDLAGSARGDKGVHILGPQAAVHQPIWKPQGASRKPMPAEMARLPSIDPLGLNGAEDRTATLPTAPVAAPVRTDQTHRLCGLGTERIEVHVEQIFVAPKLELRHLLPIACRGDHYELGSLPGPTRTSDEL